MGCGRAAFSNSPLCFGVHTESGNGLLLDFGDRFVGWFVFLGFSVLDIDFRIKLVTKRDKFGDVAACSNHMIQPPSGDSHHFKFRVDFPEFVNFHPVNPASLFGVFLFWQDSDYHV